MLADFAVPADCAPERVEEPPQLPWRRGHWSAAALARLAAHLAGAGARALAVVPIERRLAAWQGALGALLDPDSEERAALLPALVATSRLSPEGLTEALEVVLGGWTGAEAERLAARAAPAAVRAPAGVVLAANVPGLAAQSLLPALVAGRPLLVKSATAEPLFAPALVAALARREPALADAFAAVVWPGAELELARAAFAGAEVVLAYGGGEAMDELAGLLGGRLVAQGPKASVALVGGGIDTLGVGRALARDVAVLDQRGCLSIHAVWVEGDAAELAEALAFGLEIEHRRLPPGPLAPHAAARVQALRGEAELAGTLVGELELAAGTVIRAPDSGFRPSPGLRTVRVHAVPRFTEALAALAPWRGRLQGAALAGAGAAALAGALGELGVSRLAPPGELQAAGAGWANGGIDPLDVFS